MWWPERVEEKEQGKVFITEDDLFQCFSCGACEYVCPVGIEHVGRKILDLRRGLASEGRISSDRVNQLFTTMERAPHNPWGIAHDTRQKLIESKQFPIFDGTQEWLFWLGCGLSYDRARAGRRSGHAADSGCRGRFLGRAGA